MQPERNQVSGHHSSVVIKIIPDGHFWTTIPFTALIFIMYTSAIHTDVLQCNDIDDIRDFLSDANVGYNVMPWNRIVPVQWSHIHVVSYSADIHVYVTVWCTLYYSLSSYGASKHQYQLGKQAKAISVNDFVINTIQL